jgi:hypothetical protein
LLQQFVQVHFHSFLAHAQASELLDACDGGLATLGCRHDGLHGFLGIFGEIKIHIGAADNDAQNMAHRMGDLGGQIAQGAQLFHLGKLALGGLQLCIGLFEIVVQLGIVQGGTGLVPKGAQQRFVVFVEGPY